MCPARHEARSTTKQLSFLHLTVRLHAAKMRGVWTAMLADSRNRNHAERLQKGGMCVLTASEYYSSRVQMGAQLTSSLTGSCKNDPVAGLI